VAEFFHINGLVSFFVKVLFDFPERAAAMAGAFSGNPLNVFGVNAESVHICMVLVLISNFVGII